MTDPDASDAPAESTAESTDFIREIVAADNRSGKWGGNVVTRFPPEPNGFLHIGHAKSICLNFGVAAENGGRCHLRFDDTNPTTEDVRFVESIEGDVRWLGFDWSEHLFHASDYFERLHDFAVDLIRRGKAYVCDVSETEFSERYRGTIKSPGEPSPFRERSVEESLDLFARMRAGEFGDGDRCLRAKIDMASPNMKLRDPPIYRIRRATHYRTGDAWVIYPLYDFAHCLSDAVEGITHSLCTLEFENNRELYDWILDALEVSHHPQQIEFARLGLTHTVMSKRKLKALVEENLVSGWDDPRMPTLAGLRRRGVPASAIRAFCERIGIAKTESTIEQKLFDHVLRDTLNTTVPRAMAVLRPIKIVIENYPEDGEEEFDAVNFPDDPPKMGSRKVPFCRELWIERDDFMEEPAKKFFRLAPGREVRLRWAYLVTCTGVVKDQDGNVTEVRCSYDPETRGGNAPDGRRVKGTIHWVSARHGARAEVRLYGSLLATEKARGEDDGDWKEDLDPKSLEVILDAVIEPRLAAAEPGENVQFERTGYFYSDPIDHRPGDRPVWNRTVPLRDSWAKIAPQKAGGGGGGGGGKKGGERKRRRRRGKDGGKDGGGGSGDAGATAAS